MKWINICGVRINPTTINYILGVRNREPYEFTYAEGTDILFKDGRTHAFKIPVDQVDALLEGTKFA